MTNASGDWWDWPGKPAPCLRREAEQADVGSFVVVKDEPQEEVKEEPQEAAGYDEMAVQAGLESDLDADSYGWDKAAYLGQLQKAGIDLKESYKTRANAKFYLPELQELVDDLRTQEERTSQAPFVLENKTPFGKQCRSITGVVLKFGRYPNKRPLNLQVVDGKVAFVHLMMHMRHHEVQVLAALFLSRTKQDGSPRFSFSSGPLGLMVQIHGSRGETKEAKMTRQQKRNRHRGGKKRRQQLKVKKISITDVENAYLKDFNDTPVHPSHKLSSAVKPSSTPKPSMLP